MLSPTREHLHAGETRNGTTPAFRENCIQTAGRVAALATLEVRVDLTLAFGAATGLQLLHEGAMGSGTHGRSAFLRDFRRIRGRPNPPNGQGVARWQTASRRSESRCLESLHDTTCGLRCLSVLERGSKARWKLVFQQSGRIVASIPTSVMLRVVGVLSRTARLGGTLERINLGQAFHRELVGVFEMLPSLQKGRTVPTARPLNVQA